MTTALSCPNCGEQSDEPDYCSSCGHKFGGVGVSTTSTSNGSTCSTRTAPPSVRSARSGRSAVSSRSASVRGLVSTRNTRSTRRTSRRLGGSGIVPLPPLPPLDPIARVIEGIEDLLISPSAIVPGATIPLALRGLAASAQAQNKLTPSAFLRAMESSFAEARDAVFAVQAAWDTLLSAILPASRDLGQLRATAHALSADMDAEALEIAGALQAMRQRVERDPLGALRSASADLEPRLDQFRVRVAALQQVRASVDSDLARADVLVAELHSANAAAHAAQLRCQAEIRDPSGLQPTLDAGRLEGLRTWLATLRDTVARGNCAATRIGLDRWLAMAAEYSTAVHAARAANCAPSDQRDQLAGLLRARRAQSRDLARRGLCLAYDAEEDARQAQPSRPSGPVACPSLSRASHASTPRSVRSRRPRARHPLTANYGGARSYSDGWHTRAGSLSLQDAERQIVA